MTLSDQRPTAAGVRLDWELPSSEMLISVARASTMKRRNYFKTCFSEQTSLFAFQL